MNLNNFKSFFKRISEKEKEPWQISAARFCVKNSEKGFTIDELKEHVESLYKIENKNIEQFFNEEIKNPAGTKYQREFLKNENINYWFPPLDLVSKVTDYDELKEARKNSKQAFWLSFIAIIISLTTLVISISLEYGNNQSSVEQLNTLKNIEYLLQNKK